MNGHVGHVSPIISFRRKSQLLVLTGILAARRSISTGTLLRPVPSLASWDSALFDEAAYKPKVPVRLPRSRAHVPPACAKWFIHDADPDFNLFEDSSSQTRGTEGTNEGLRIPSSSELRSSFWSEYESTFVPLEVTTRSTSTGVSREAENENEDEDFQRIEAPLKALLAYLSQPPLSAPSGTTTTGAQQQSSDQDHNVSIYLAQCDLSSLPSALQSDVPLPQLLHRQQTTTTRPVKGDIYASSLWLGRPPTYTPLHRDPNPNLFIHLVGMKTVRLLPPEIGDALFHDVTTRLSSTAAAPSSSKIRGEEMMIGAQKTALHSAIWPSYPSSSSSSSPNPDPASPNANIYNQILERHGLETTLGLGEALFIPKGWWHSVKGVGTGVTASVNWWFR